MTKKLELTSAIKDEFNPDTATYPLMGFRKVDGVRAGHLHGFFHGRSLDPFKNTALNEKFNGAQYAGFDGELTVDGLLTDETLDGETLCSVTTGLTNRSKLAKGETELPCNAVWNLFDYLGPDAIDLEYYERYKALCRVVGERLPKNVRILTFEWINNPDEARAWIDDCLEKNYEGAIFREPKAKYKSGRATATANDFWRYKPVSDKDAVVVGFEAALANNNEATINSRGRTERSAHQENRVAKEEVGVLIGFCLERNDVVRIGPGRMKAVDKAASYADPTLIVGHPIKYTSLDVGVKDAPRQARFKERRAWADLEKLTPEQRARVDELLKEYA